MEIGRSHRRALGCFEDGPERSELFDMTASPFGEWQTSGPRDLQTRSPARPRPGGVVLASAAVKAGLWGRDFRLDHYTVL
jgi:hypothetical protein